MLLLLLLLRVALKEKIISVVNQYDIDFIMPYDELEIREVTLHKEELIKYAHLFKAQVFDWLVHFFNEGTPVFVVSVPVAVFVHPLESVPVV